MKKITAIIICLLTISNVFAQLTVNPKIDSRDGFSLIIEEVELTEDFTIVYCKHVASLVYDRGGWVTISPDTYLMDRTSNEKYSLITARGIPISPSKHYYNAKGETLSFRLVFPRISSNCTLIDLVECPNSKDCFNFYGIHLNKASSVNSTEATDLGTFSVDYDLLAVLSAGTESWTDWMDATMKVVFNVNRNGDVKLITPQEEQLLRRAGEVEMGSMDNGLKYKMLTTMDENNTIVDIQLFLSGDMKLIYPDGSIIQFTDSRRIKN